MTVSDVEVRELSEQHTAVVRHTISIDETSKIPEWILQTMEAVQRSGQDIAGPPFFRSFSMGEDSMDIEVGWPVAEPFAGDGEVLASTLPGGVAAVAAYYGPFEEIEPA